MIRVSSWIAVLSWAGLPGSLPAHGEPAPPSQDTVRFGANPVAGRYLQVDDARIYFEVYGKGEPVVLLHGGLFGYIDEFARLIPALSRDYMVIAIATRGHGKSELGRRPLSYRLFAEDCAAIIRSLQLPPVNLIGFSDGAIAAYHVAATHPDRVRRLIAVGGPLGLRGYSAAGAAELDRYNTPAKLEGFASAFVARRKRLMPDSTVWSSFVRQLNAMWSEPEYISQEAVRAIRTPALVAAGDRDQYLTLEHLLEVFRLLPQGRVAVIPGSGHTVFDSQHDLMVGLIREFLGRPAMIGSP
jgi:pimeloyl-ACP methyl ester carboxylesterase